MTDTPNVDHDAASDDGMPVPPGPDANAKGAEDTAPPSKPLADAVSAEFKGPTEEQQKAADQLARQIGMQMQQAHMARQAQRLAIAVSMASGIASGLYSQPDALVAGFGDKVIDTAFKWADQLIERANQDAKAAMVPGAANH